MNSILDSIKKMLGIEAEYTHFDADIITHINSVFTILYQLGVGDSTFQIEDNTATWEDFKQNRVDLNSVKSYMFMKVKLLFDPPMSSAVMESMNRLISEFEWRINVTVDPNVQNGVN